MTTTLLSFRVEEVLRRGGDRFPRDTLAGGPPSTPAHTSPSGSRASNLFRRGTWGAEHGLGGGEGGDNAHNAESVSVSTRPSLSNSFALLGNNRAEAPPLSSGYHLALLGESFVPVPHPLVLRKYCEGKEQTGGSLYLEHSLSADSSLSPVCKATGGHMPHREPQLHAGTSGPIGPGTTNQFPFHSP